MNNHQLGCRRDRLVLDALADWGTMDTDQIRIQFFPSARVARRRLQLMSKRGKVKRIREAIETPYSYFLKRYEPNRIALNWVRLWMLRRMKSWEVMEHFDYETNTCVILNTVTNTIKTYNVFYNINRQIWIDGDAVIVFDHEEHRSEAAKRIKATLLTVEEIREELKCWRGLSLSSPHY